MSKSETEINRAERLISGNRKEYKMGYESRLYIVEKSDFVRTDSMCWGEIIAVFNLCKVYEVSDKMCKYKATDAYIYADDGNTKITEDSYGDSLKEIPLPDAIEILEEAAAHDDYRRFAPCIQMLKGFDTSQWSNLVVLHYGY